MPDFPVADHARPSILVTGATGYLGGRLVPRLIVAGYGVRCLVRDPQRLRGRSWENQVEIVVGDALHPESLVNVLADIDVAYYLIHSMKMGEDYHKRDLMAATNFGQAAREAGVKRIIYLGGLGDPDTTLSDHLRSRQSTGEALRLSGVPVLEFRSAMIIGSGSLSFEIMRYLTERLPIIMCPFLVYKHTQPIAVSDMLDYLIAALSISSRTDEIIEVGGADALTYREIMLSYARLRGLKRFLFPVPIPTPLLFSNWILIDTPIPAVIARPLILSLQNDTIVRSDAARRLFPDIQPMGYCKAVQEALDQLEAGLVETAWSDALSSSLGDIPPVIMKNHEGMIIENRQLVVDAPATNIFRTFITLGGSRGWFYLDWAWRLRGVIDLLLGGVGLRRGRRIPDDVRIGDVVDFWRVEAVESDRLLRLRAEIKVPGKAWLQFQVHPHCNGQSLLQQTAYFAPKGLAGILYWYLLYPVHNLIFSGMIRGIAKRAARFGS